MLENLSPKQKNLISWGIFLVILLLVGFVSYYYFSYKMLNYQTGVCLEEFNESYSSYGLIYEYDVSCKEIFSDYSNSDYCNSIKNKDFCYYSFASFSKDKSLKEAICVNISSSDFCKNL